MTSLYTRKVLFVAFACVAFAFMAGSRLAHADTLCFPDGCITDTQSVRSHVGGTSALESMLSQIRNSPHSGSFRIAYDASGLPTQIACFNGMTLTAFYYTCPAGQVGTPPNCHPPVPSGCGPGTLNDRCASGSSSTSTRCTPSSVACGRDGNLHDDCGGVISCGTAGCSSATNTCNNTCRMVPLCSSDGSAILNSCTGGVFQDCAAEGKICSSGICVLPPISFSEMQALNEATAFTASGHLQAAPSLVRRGSSAHVYWNVAHASACSVTGDNGDGWTGLSSGTSGTSSRAIMQPTRYTLRCSALPGATPPSVEESITVNVVPVFQEQ